MELTQTLPSAWQFNSPVEKSGCGTAQFSYDLFSCAPGRLVSRGSLRNTVLINMGEPLAISHWANYQWQTFIAGSETTICILPAGAQFEMKWAQPLQMLVFAFEDSFTTAYPGRGIDLRSQWNISDELLATLAKRASTVAHTPYFAERIYMESLAVACVEQISRQYRGADNEIVKGRLSPQQLLNVLAFAHDCMQMDIGLVELANLVHLSPYHFGRLFKQTIGLSPYQYLLQLRIEFAKKLIVERTGPLGDIAYQLNFSDQAHFSNAFRKATGISPRQYLQSHAPA